MKTNVLTAINSKYIHSNTAVWYLFYALEKAGIDSVVESFTINDSKSRILRGIMKHNPSSVCFSCYLWNIRIVLELISDIKKIDKDIKIILGGPEVSFKCDEILKNSKADFIIRGEGETCIAQTLHAAYGNTYPKSLGAVYIKEGKYHDMGYNIVEDLDTIPSPFTPVMIEREKNRILYYETSRGCIYNCIYCLSSCAKGIRYFSLDRVFDDLEKIIYHKPHQIKFVDRTFNCNNERTLKILDFIKNLKTDTNFHIEIHPALLHEDIMEKLRELPAGRVQAEAGIQSTNEKTLKVSGRYQDSEKALNNLERILDFNNIHLHLDLIAGLPYEDFTSFRRSFNETIEKRPHMLQLGFLKILKGTSIEDIKGYEYSMYAPYEILRTPWLSWDDINNLKLLEECLEIYYNSKKFTKSLEYAYGFFDSPFDFFLSFGNWMHEKNNMEQNLSMERKYEIFLEFMNNDVDLRDLLKLDFMSSFDTKIIPSFMRNERDIEVKEKLIGFLKDRKMDFKKYSACELPINGAVRTIMFDYSKKCPVTGRFSFQDIEL